MTDHSALVADLIAALGADAVIVDPAAMWGYREDRSGLPAGMPVAVARPADTAGAQAVVRAAARHGVPIVTRGAGTSLAGGSTAQDGAITLSLDRMRRIEIDPETRTARVEPGALNRDVKAAALEHGLWYPPDPASFEICSIGGNLATNAGGLSCVKHGVTREYVLGLEVVLADGTAIRLGGPLVKDVAGLPLLQLFVGSEGTLGIITEATLRLTPAPHPLIVGVAYFASVEAAARAVVDATTRFRPALCEFMDQATLDAVERTMRMGLDTTQAAMLIIGTDQAGEAAAAELAIIADVFQAAGATESFIADDAEMSEQFLAARRFAAHAYETLGTTLAEDVGVPVPRLPEALERIREIGERHGVLVATVAHAGDGNTHPNVIYDPTDAAAADRAHAAFADIMALAVEFGGTITGEHGVGTMKRPYLATQLGGDVMALTAAVKRTFDPDGILNPGIGI